MSINPQFLWKPITTNEKIGSYFSICNDNSNIIVYSYASSKQSFIFVSIDKGIIWKNILPTNYQDPYPWPKIYDINIVHSGSNYYILATSYQELVSYTYFGKSKTNTVTDLTNSSSWTWSYSKGTTQSSFFNALPVSINYQYSTLSYYYTDKYYSYIVKYTNFQSSSGVGFLPPDKEIIFNGIECSPDGSKICAFGNDGNTNTIYSITPENMNTVVVYSNTLGSSGIIVSLSISNSGNIVFVLKSSNYVYSINRGTTSAITGLPLDTWVGLVIAQDGSTLCAITSTNIYIYIFSSQIYFATNLGVGVKGYTAISASPDMKYILVSVGGTNTMYLSETGGVDSRNIEADNITYYDSISSYNNSYTLDSLGNISTSGSIIIRNPTKNIQVGTVINNVEESSIKNIVNNQNSVNFDFINQLEPLSFEIYSKTVTGFLPSNIEEASTKTNSNKGAVIYNAEGDSYVNPFAFIAPLVSSIQVLNKKIKCIEKQNKKLKKLLKNNKK